MTKHIAVIGCSYSNWSDGMCKFKSYPFFIAQTYKDYNVVDLSIPGSSNNSAYIRIKAWEKQNNIKFDKIIMQITHTVRDYELPKDSIDFFKDNLYMSTNNNENYFYTNTNFNNSCIFNVTTQQLSFEYSALNENLSKTYNVDLNALKEFYFKRFETYRYYWELQQQVDLLNGRYGDHDVLFFSWHKNADITDVDIRSKIDLPENYIGSIEELLGTDTFYSLGIDDSPHYGKTGHTRVFEVLQPFLKRLLQD